MKGHAPAWKKPRPRRQKTVRGEARIVEQGDGVVAFAHVHTRPVRQTKKAETRSDRHSRSGKASAVAKWTAIDERIKPIAERLKSEGVPVRKWASKIQEETGLDLRTIRLHLHSLGYRPPTKKRT